MTAKTTPADSKPRQTTHTTFTIERVYDATAARVFDAWARPEAKAHWFHGPDGWKETERTLQFEVGGREVGAGRFADGHTSRFEALYHDIVAGERIVYSYVMHVDGVKISTSLATVTLRALDGDRTRLTFTEHAAFLDGFEDGGGRERGTTWLLGNIAEYLDPSLAGTNRAHP